jgi:ABC-type multidrug transport system ATPase subunit
MAAKYLVRLRRAKRQRSPRRRRLYLKDFALEELGHQAVLELSEMMKRPLKVLASLGHQEVDMAFFDWSRSL